MKSIALSAIAALLAAGPGVAQKQQDDRAGLPSTYKGPASAVAAIVNDKVITTFDVQQRMKLMLMSAGGRITPQMLPQLQRQA
ncbi:MAG: hypothetical protein HXY21_14255, partial [Parvularculaceae bacterium]|nr:hypothetical protein [Parvularculaceae bacterium]